MEKLKDELISLRSEILSGKDITSKERVVITGDKPILLTTTMFIDPEGKYQDDFYSFFKKNNLDVSFIDMLIYILNKRLGVYGVIDYVPMSYANDKLKDYKSQSRFYYDKDLRDYFNKFGIDAFYSLNYERFMVNQKTDMASFHEGNSSFCFAGLTGITKELQKMFDMYNLMSHTMFGGMGKSDFDKLGIHFTDDVIKYNKCLDLGKVRNKLVDRHNMWPRTVDISLNSSIDFEEFSNLFLEYIEWVIEELEQKGVYGALEPMRRL